MCPRRARPHDEAWALVILSGACHAQPPPLINTGVSDAPLLVESAPSPPRQSWSGKHSVEGYALHIEKMGPGFELEWQDAARVGRGLGMVDGATLVACRRWYSRAEYDVRSKMFGDMNKQLAGAPDLDANIKQWLQTLLAYRCFVGVYTRRGDELHGRFMNGFQGKQLGSEIIRGEEIVATRGPPGAADLTGTAVFAPPKATWEVNTTGVHTPVMIGMFVESPTRRLEGVSVAHDDGFAVALEGEVVIYRRDDDGALRVVAKARSSAPR